MSLTSQAADSPTLVKEHDGRHRQARSRTMSVERLASGRLPIFSILVVISAVFAAFAPGFFTSASADNIATSTALFLLIALGETFVIISAGIDISVSSNLALTGVIGAIVLSGLYSGHGSGVPATILTAVICVAIGAAGGLINGLIVSILNVAPLIATLGTWGAFYGLAELFSTQYAVGALPPSSYTLGNGGPIGGYVVWITLACVVLFSFVLWRTRFGRYVRAMGANQEATVRSGVRVKTQLCSIYVIAGLMAGLAGFLSVAHFQTASPDTGSSYLLIAIAAVVIGGTTLTGGEGSVWGTLVGALIISVLENGFVLIGINAFWQLVAVGAATVLAVYFDQLQGRLRARLVSASASGP